MKINIAIWLEGHNNIHISIRGNSGNELFGENFKTVEEAMDFIKVNTEGSMRFYNTLLQPVNVGELIQVDKLVNADDRFRVDEILE